MHEPLTKMQTWLLRAWVYGVILGFLGAASLYGPFTPDRVAYKVVRFLLVTWLLVSFDQRGRLDRILLNNLVKCIGIGFLFILILVVINETRFPKGLPHLYNGFLLSAVLAIPLGTALALLYTNSAAQKQEGAGQQRQYSSPA